MAANNEDKKLGVIVKIHTSQLRETDKGYKCNKGEIGETLFQKPNRELYAKKIEKEVAENNAEKEAAKTAAKEKAAAQKAQYDAAVVGGFNGTIEEWLASQEEKKANDEA